MPVRVSSFDNRRLPPTISRQWNNQSPVAEVPDPNGGMDAYKRNNPPAIQGTHGVASATGNPMNDPRTPISLAGLDAAANATDQGYAAQSVASNQREVQLGQMTHAEAAGRNQQDKLRQTAVAVMNPNARRYTQALKNAGVDKLRTGAAHEPDAYQGSSFGLEATTNARHGEKPGFFDVQDHDYLAKLQRLDQLALSDYTRNTQRTR